MGTSCGRCRDVHAITGYFDILGVFRGDPLSALTGFQNAVQTPWHRRLV